MANVHKFRRMKKIFLDFIGIGGAKSANLSE